MFHRNLAVRACGSLLAGLTLLWVVGCSDDGLGKRYPVSGTVKYNGQPVAKARINFVPKDGGGHAAFGTVENGTFSSLTTLTDGDGALPGAYKVTVDDREVDEAKVKSQADDLAKKHKMGNITQIPPELQGKAMKAAKGSIPGKYQIDSTSNLEAKVEPKSNTFEFTLDNN